MSPEKVNRKDRHAVSKENLREVYNEPSQMAKDKVLKKLDKHCQQIISLSPFVCLATTAADGSLDISPRGDPPGSVKLLDTNTLLIPDRAGNNRLDTLSNLIVNPEIGLLFLVPGVIETLRVSGLASVIQDDPRLKECEVNGKVPPTGILVEVQQAFLQCGKALKRSALWDGTYQIDRSTLPSFGTMLADQTGTETTASELDCSIDEAYENRLY
jgi:hypothetical protein